MSNTRSNNRAGNVRFHIGDWGDLLSNKPQGRRIFTQQAAKAGFDGIDVIIPSKAQVGGADFLNPTDYSGDTLKAEVDWYAGLSPDFKIGDVVPFVWAHDPFANGTNETNAWVKCCVEALSFMTQLRSLGILAEGAGMRIDTSVKTHEMKILEASWVKTFAPRAKHVGKIARDLGIPVYMEPEPCWPGIHNRTAVIEMLTELEGSGVDVMYDFAHAFLQGQTEGCQPTGLRPFPDHTGFINALGQRVGKLHVADTTGKLHGQSGHAPTGEHAIPGDGILSENNFAPMKAIIRHLAATIKNFGNFKIWTADVCMVDDEKLRTCFPTVLKCMQMLHKEVEHVYAA